MAKYNGVVLQSLRYMSTQTCAVTIVNNFPYYDADYYKKKVDEDLKGYIKAASEATYQQGVSDNIASSLLVTLNEDQRKEWGELLIANGFVLMSSFLNSREENTVHMYLWNKKPQPDPAEWKMRNDEDNDDDEENYDGDYDEDYQEDTEF